MYAHESPEAECPPIEDKIKRIKEQLEIDKMLIDSLDEFISFHGQYSLQELKMPYCYGILSHSIKNNTATLVRLIEKQTTT